MVCFSKESSSSSNSASSRAVVRFLGGRARSTTAFNCSSGFESKGNKCFGNWAAADADDLAEDGTIPENQTMSSELDCTDS